MQQLRFSNPQEKQVDERVIKYALNPPCSSIPTTHYATVTGDTMEYLCLDGDWFVKTFGWQYIQHVPHCTPIGEVEIPRWQEAKETIERVYKHVATPVYSNSKYKGD